MGCQRLAGDRGAIRRAADLEGGLAFNLGWGTATGGAGGVGGAGTVGAGGMGGHGGTAMMGPYNVAVDNVGGLLKYLPTDWGTAYGGAGGVGGVGATTGGTGGTGGTAFNLLASGTAYGGTGGVGGTGATGGNGGTGGNVYAANPATAFVGSGGAAGGLGGTAGGPGSVTSLLVHRPPECPGRVTRPALRLSETQIDMCVTR